jgi:predicted acyltransferase
MEQVARRSITLVMLGLILQGFPNLRLTGPFILTIIGVTLFWPERREGEPAGGRRWVGAGVLVVAATWFALNWDHFNGRVVGFDPRHFFWPMSNEVKFVNAAGGEVSGWVLRVPGVLQRIGLAYFFASIIMLFTQTAGRVAWTAVLLAGYWVICQHDFVARYFGHQFGGGVPGTVMDATAGAPYPGLLHDWIDSKLLGAHLYRYRPDPEGLLSTIPAIATVLTGILTGTWMRSGLSKERICLGLFFAGNVLVVAGLFWGYEFPINKKIWTSSYVLAMTGFALHFLAVCYYLLDIKGQRKWAGPFLVFGTNAIFVFFGSGILARAMSGITWVKADGTGLWNLRNWIWERGIQDPILTVFSKVDLLAEVSRSSQMKFASLVFALLYIGLWLLLTYPLYRKKIFLKI